MSSDSLVTSIELLKRQEWIWRRGCLLRIFRQKKTDYGLLLKYNMSVLFWN